MPGEILFYGLTMLFGTSSSQNPMITVTYLRCFLAPHTIDVLAFAIIAFTAWRSRRIGFPSAPSILNTIMHDATLYFLLVFSAHFLSLLFLFVAPVSDT
jgi:hypothetical protein